MSLPPAPVNREALLSMLDNAGLETTTIDHPAVFTVNESKTLRGTIEGAHTKNLFLKDKKGQLFLLTAKEDSTVNLKTLHKLIGGSSRFSFGSAELMEDCLGVTPGSVTAFGIVNDRENRVKFVLDERLMAFDVINCHPLTNEATTSIARDDLLAFARLCHHEPLIVDLTQDA